MASGLGAGQAEEPMGRQADSFHTAAGHIVWPKSETPARPRGRASSQLLAACIAVKGHLSALCFLLHFISASSLNCCRE